MHVHVLLRIVNYPLLFVVDYYFYFVSLRRVCSSSLGVENRALAW